MDMDAVRLFEWDHQEYEAVSDRPDAKPPVEAGKAQRGYWEFLVIL
jgi:hypothetical protein